MTRIYVKKMDPPLIINLYEWQRLFINKEEEEEDDELGLENWVTQKLVNKMGEQFGILIDMECLHWESTGEIRELELIIPEDLPDEFCEDMFASKNIQYVLDALFEEMMDERRRRIVARPKARKIKFVLDIGKQVPQRKKGPNVKRKVKRVSAQDLQSQRYKRRKIMWWNLDYIVNGPIKYLIYENERLRKSYFVEFMNDDNQLLQYFFSMLRPKLNDLLNNNIILVDHYIQTIDDTGKVPEEADKTIDEAVEQITMDVIKNYKETLQKKSDLYHCLSAILQKYPLAHITHVIHLFPPSQKIFLAQWFKFTFNKMRSE